MPASSSIATLIRRPIQRLHGYMAGYANTSGAVCELDLRDRLDSIRCPTLVIGGTYDLATPLAWNETIASSIPGARFETLRAAHLSNIEAHDEFNRVVSEFLL